MKNRLLLIYIACSIFVSSCYRKKVEMKEQLVKNNEVEIFTQSFGEEKNPAILLISGATVSMLYWDEEFCTQLAANGFFVIRFDNRDVGKSTFYEPGEAQYDIVDLTNDVIAILDDYEIDQAHLVGMSLGGLISQIAAINYPERIQTMTLFATGPWGDSDPSIPEMDTRILDFHSKASSVDWTNEDSVVTYLIKGSQLMSGKKEFERERIENLIRAEFNRANNYISMFNHATLAGGEKFWDRLDEIQQPTLVIHGTEDKIWHYRNASVLVRKIKKSKLLTLEGTGHELHSQDWNVIIEGIKKHIKGD
ncbi:macrolide hydrolase EstT [Echinicola vietnamensis]|nr:macrolide hydrolase EstT [Echinicola vietnamensis]